MCAQGNAQAVQAYAWLDYLHVPSYVPAGGTLQATVMYHGIKVYTRSNDLCASVACPVLPGVPVDLFTTTTIPWWAPPGAYRWGP